MTQRNKIKESAAGGAVGGGAVAAVPSRLLKGSTGIRRRQKVAGIPVIKYKNEANDVLNKLSLRQSFLTGLLNEYAQNMFSPADVEGKMRAAEKKMDFQQNTIAFGLQDDQGNIVKVYVRPEQANDFQQAVSSQLEDAVNTSAEIAELLFNLHNRFDIVHTEWPNIAEDQEEELPAGGEGDVEGGDEGELPDLEGMDEVPPGDEGAMAPSPDEGVKSALNKVIDMLKSDAEARKAEADAKAAEARAKEAEYTAQIATQKVRSEQEVLDAEAYYRQKKEDQKEARKLTMLAKYRHDQARETEDGMVQGMFGEGYRQYSGVDRQLDGDGWEENGGIGLWSNPHYTVWVDTNPGEIIIVYPIRNNGAFRNSEDDFVTMVRTYEELQDWLNDTVSEHNQRLPQGVTNGTFDYAKQESEWHEEDKRRRVENNWDR
jgi:hypothetical protein